MEYVFYILTLIGAAQGIFFSLVLLRIPTGHPVANRYLALFLLVFSLSMLGIVFYGVRWVLAVPALGLIHLPFTAILGAPFVLYILALTRKSFRFGIRHALLFAPFAVVAIWAMPFYLKPAAEKRAILEASYGQWPSWWTEIFIFSNAMNFLYLAAAFFLILHHERVIREVYADPTNKTLRWTRHFLYTGVAIFVSCVLLSLRNISWSDAYSNMAFTIAIYIFGYRAMSQPEIFADLSSDFKPEELPVPLIRQKGRYEKSGLTAEKARTLLERLDELMARDRLYLDPLLNLQQMADRLELPPYQVSQLLNQVRGENFSDFVNRYRVDHLKRLMRDPAVDHYSLLALAFESGFNSKAVFNAVFKKMTGLTPSEYKKQPD